MKKTAFTLLLALTGAAAMAAPNTPAPTTPVPATPAIAPPAAPAVPEVTLYDGKAAGPATPSVANWGGGSGEDSTETFIFGGHSLKVTTLDLYQGARITFPTPVSLAGDNRVFQITVRRGGSTLHYDPQTTSALPPGDTPNGFPGQGRGGFGFPGQFGGQNGGRFGRRGRRNRTGQGEGPAEAPLIPPVENLRLSFTFADGRQTDVLRPVPDVSDDLAGEGWYSINVPVSALKLGGSNPLLKSVTIGGDHYGVFFVGRIKLGSDTPTLAITIDGPATVLPGQPVTLTAQGGGAFSALKYAWDLDAGNGVLDRPTGETASARYFEPGQDHTVTLTVTDLDGLKKPITVTKVIHVSGQGGNGPGFGGPGVVGPGVVGPGVGGPGGNGAAGDGRGGSRPGIPPREE